MRGTGSTALHWAAGGGALAVVQCVSIHLYPSALNPVHLRQSIISFSLQLPQRYRVVYLPVLSHRFLVKECGVDIHQACDTGRKDQRNAMHWAARNGHTEVCAWLHQPSETDSSNKTADSTIAGVDVDACTTDGTVAFHWACWQGQFGERKGGNLLQSSESLWHLF